MPQWFCAPGPARLGTQASAALHCAHTTEEQGMSVARPTTIKTHGHAWHQICMQLQE